MAGGFVCAQRSDFRHTGISIVIVKESVAAVCEKLPHEPALNPSASPTVDPANGVGVTRRDQYQASLRGISKSGNSITAGCTFKTLANFIARSRPI